ncbi:MAG: tetraacyldisaccharide 4'-kinase [Alistipes sp.]|nr:tetraacyldisaccharide 4'-kinase [Alistipes sp.]
MMKLVKTILSWIYALVIAIRHRLYDWGVYKSYTFSVPVVCVGNITVGGTGKTPMVEYLLANLADSYNIAILSRGYGRSTKGYREVTLEDSYMDVGDEPLQMKLKFPNNTIVVAEDRVEAINRILREHPEVTLILMDDGFQHRRVKAKVNIILVDSTRPVKRDRMLPLGRLRDFRSRLSAAHFFVVTKCSEEMSPLDRRLWRNELRTVAYQKVYFTTVAQRPVVPLFHCEEREEVNYGQHAILLSGIGNPRHFARSAEQHFYVVAKFFYEDHHSYTADDLRAIYAKLKSNPRAIVLMTEKDAVKLRRARRLPEMLRRAMYYQPIDVEFIEGPDRDFIGNLKREIELRPSSKRENEEDKR